MTIDLQWCEFAAQGRKVPIWVRSAALASDGTVFIPAMVAGSESDAILSAGYDGVTMVRYRGHAYVPANWLRQEYPHAADLTMKIERGVREYFA
jgi:hypothetical protein